MELFWGINRGVREEKTKRSLRISILSTTAIIIIIIIIITITIILATVLADNITITYFQEHLVIFIRLDLVLHPEIKHKAINKPKKGQMRSDDHHHHHLMFNQIHT